MIEKKILKAHERRIYETRTNELTKIPKMKEGLNFLWNKDKLQWEWNWNGDERRRIEFETTEIGDAVLETLVKERHERKE